MVQSTDNDLIETYLERSGMAGNVDGIVLLTRHHAADYLRKAPRGVTRVVIDPQAVERPIITSFEIGCLVEAFGSAESTESNLAMKLTRTFTAISADGKKYAVDVYQALIDASDSDGAKTLLGLPRLRTRDGQTVQKIDTGKYRIDSEPPVFLTSTDPDAI